jgi:hypothetical protein
MSDRKTVIGEMIANLRQQRDELALQMHLGKAEAKQQWEKLEEQLAQLAAQYEPLQDAAEDAAENVWAGLELTAKEVQRGFQNVSRALLDQLKDKDDA